MPNPTGRSLRLRKTAAGWLPVDASVTDARRWKCPKCGGLFRRKGAHMRSSLDCLINIATESRNA